MGFQLVLSYQKILITGCNGFIGKSLTERCLANGCTVLGVIRDPSRKVGLKDIPLKYVGEIGPSTDWKDTLRGVDAVVHLAGISETAGKTIKKQYFYQVNTAGTEHLARCAAKAGVRRFVFISTIKIHGEVSDVALRETDSPNPFSSYAASKLKAETAVREISLKTGMEYVILRPAVVYGPGVRGSFLKLMTWIAKGIPLPFGAIKNRRSFLFIGNLIEGIMNSLTHPRAACKTFLVADPDPLSTPELIRRVSNSLAIRQRLYYFPVFMLKILFVICNRKKEFMSLAGSLWADTSSIQKEIGWRPTASIKTGIQITVSWFRDKAIGVIL